MQIYGTDYPSPDGTCVRDYIHVSDLASAHVKALEYLEKGGKSDIFNCGYGKGFSVREVLNKVKEVTGKNFTVIESPRRPGDPAMLIARAERIQKILGWMPKLNDLAGIVKTTYDWEQKRPY
jgi:UDP-glucose 4-epimerase